MEQDMNPMTPAPEAAQPSTPEAPKNIDPAVNEVDTIQDEDDDDEEEESEGFFSKLRRRVRNGFRSDEEEAKLDAELHELTHAPNEKYNGQFITEVEHKCDGKLIDQILKINNVIIDSCGHDPRWCGIPIDLAIEHNIDLRPYCKAYDIDGNPTLDKSKVCKIEIRDASEHGIINFTSYCGGKLQRGNWDKLIATL